MKLSSNIESIFAIGEDGAAVTVQTILDRVNVKSFGILLVIFAIPSAMPVPAPGYSIPGGIIFLSLGWQLLKREDQPWLPERVLAKEVQVAKRPRLIRMMIFTLRFMEFFIRPRLAFVFNDPVLFRIMALLIMICGLSMCIPVPLTNTAPAFGVFLVGLGMLEEDGFLSGLGMLACVIGLLLTATVLVAIAYYGSEGVDIVKNAIKSLFP